MNMQLRQCFARNKLFPIEKKPDFESLDFLQRTQKKPDKKSQIGNPVS